MERFIPFLFAPPAALMVVLLLGTGTAALIVGIVLAAAFGAWAAFSFYGGQRVSGVYRERV